jgi:hypothetical protein
MPLFGEIINQAYSITMGIQDSYQLCNAQVTLLPLLLEMNDPRYRAILDNATVWLENLDKNPELETMASELFKCLISAKYFDDALDKVRVIPVLEIQSGLIGELASKMIENDQIDDGIELIDILTDIQGWIDVFYKVCLALVEKKLPDKVVELAFQVHDDDWTQAWEWSSSLYYLSYALAERRFIRQAKDLVHFIPDQEMAQVAMGEVLMLADTFSGDEYIKDTLRGEGFIDDDAHPEDELRTENANSLDVSDLIKKGKLRQALRYANEVSNKAGSDAVYFQIIKSLVIQGDLDEAFRVHQAIKTPQWKEQALVELCIGFSRQKQVDRAIKIANSVKDPVLQYKILDQIAFVSEEISPTESESLFSHITNDIFSIESPVIKTSVYRNHANYLARANRRYSEKAYQLLNTANQIAVTFYSRPKDFALSKITIALAPTITFDKVQLLINKITDNRWKEITISELEMPKGTGYANLVPSDIQEDILEDFADSNERLDSAVTVNEISNFENYLSTLDVNRALEKISAIRRLISTIDDYSIQSQMERAFSTYLAKNGKWVEALENLGDRDLDEFIEIIADWCPYFEHYDKNLPSNVITQSIEIASWFRSDWGEIYQILNSQ